MSAGVVVRVATSAYNTWIISLKDSYSVYTLITGRVLMNNLATTLMIIFGFNIVDIVGFSFFSMSILALYFGGGIVGNNRVLWFWCR